MVSSVSQGAGRAPDGRKYYGVPQGWATPGREVEVDLQAPMVGREREFRQLAKHVEDAVGGRGSLVLISGEAGIGKTRLVQEIKTLAASKGVQIFSGWGLFESLTPYMPFREALRTGGLEQLFAESAPRVEAAYLVTHTGLLVKSALREGARLDPDLFASMLLTVGRFVQESLSKLQGEDDPGTLTRLDYGGHSILLNRGPSANLIAVVDGRENEFLVRDMGEVVLRVHESYGRVLETWNGDEDGVRGIEESLQPLLSRHDGIRYGEANPKGRRNLLFENVCLGLARRAEIGPILLCIEDLHWADPSTVALLHYIARNTRTCGVCILGTYRPEDLSAEGGRPHHLVGAMQRMEREDLFDVVELRRLPAPDTAKVLSSVLGGGTVPEELARRIQEDTEGNPLFVVELVRLMLEEGWLRRENGGWSSGIDLREVDVPRRVQAVIQRRLGRLGDAERQILDVAATNGEEFTAVIVASALDLEPVALQPALRALEQRHRLIRAQDDRYRFDHVKIKEVLYDDLPPEFQSRCHGLVASAMETQYHDRLDDLAGEIAFHYYRSGERKKALPYLRRAMDRASKQFANAEAIRFCSEALELEEDDVGRVGLLETQGALDDLIGDYGGALASYRRVLDLAGGEGKRAETLGKMGRIFTKQGEYEESIRACREALSLVEGKASFEEALALTNLGDARFQRGDYDQALDALRKGLEISERTGDHKGIAQSLNNAANVHLARGEYDQALEGYRKGLEIWEKLGDLQGVAGSVSNAARVHARRGDYDQALEGYRRSLEIFRRIGDQWGEAMVLHNVAGVHFAKGDYDQALEGSQESLEISARIGDQPGVAHSLGGAATLHAERGEYDQALQGYRKAAEVLRRIGDLRGIAQTLDNAATVHFECGDYDEALEGYAKSLEIWERIGNQEGIAVSLSNAAILHAERGQYDQALEEYRKSLELRERIGDPRGMALVLMNLGWAHEEHGSRDLAIECVERSLKIAGDLGAVAIELPARLILAEICFRMGDLDKAQSLSQSALSDSTRLNLKPNISQAQRILGMVGRERRAWKESISYFEQTVETSIQQGSRLMEGKSRYEFGLMWKMKGDAANAREQLDSAAGIFRGLGLERWLSKVEGAREEL